MKSSSIALSPFSTWTNIHSKLGTRLVMSKAGDQRAVGNPVVTDRPSRCTTHHSLRWDLGRTKRKHVYTNQSLHVWDVDDEAKRVYENAIRAMVPMQHTLLLRRSSESLPPILYNLLHSLSKAFLPAHRSLVIGPELHLPTGSSLFRVFKEEPRLGI
jgi:hypothetical protein